MIKVHKYGPAFGLPDSSPFVTKVETYLRLIGEPYETLSADVRKAPRRQLPCAEIEGVLVPDSTAIIDLIESKRPTKLDGHLDEKQRAVAHAFKAMLEEHLYFGMLHLRWGTEGGWSVFEPNLREMLGKMGVPTFLRGMIAKKARKQVVGRGATQGIGRKPHAELVATCNQIIDSLAVQLGDGPYFLGAKPSTYDATVYAFAAGMLCPAFTNEVRAHAETKPNLVSYAQRMKAEYWKD
ncbi:MAG: glutathione S-transferase [Myxococcales bacterium]|nr:glutathione S-transferase [Myxococcales bacterium]